MMTLKPLMPLTASTLLLVTALSANALAHAAAPIPVTADAATAPRLERAVTLVGLQPSHNAPEAASNPNWRGRSSEGKSIIVDSWRLAVDYSWTADGWVFSSYRATRITAAEVAAETSGTGAGAAQSVPPGAAPYLPAALPPEPDDYPPPPRPEKPDGTGQTTINDACPYPGTRYDLRVQWVWIPGHAAGPGHTKPGHWRQMHYLMYSRAFGGAPFCQ